jgi:anti-anti-sigma regulatory factor
MLRLTRTAETHPTQTIKLEGQLSGAWVEEVRKAFAAGPSSSSGIGLDLSALTFVDTAGKRLLHDLIAEGFEVAALSGYVAELLRSGGGARLSERR